MAMDSDSFEAQKRLNDALRALREYFQKDFATDVAKGISALPSQTSKASADLNAAVTSLEKAAEKMLNAAIAMSMAANNQQDAAEAHKQAADTMKDSTAKGGGLGSGGGSSGGGGDGGGPNKQTPSSASDGSAVRVHLTKSSADHLAEEIKRQLTLFSELNGHGGGFGGGHGSSKADPHTSTGDRGLGRSAADNYQEASFGIMLTHFRRWKDLQHAVFGKPNTAPEGQRSNRISSAVDTIGERSRLYIIQTVGSVLTTAMSKVTDIVSGKRGMEAVVTAFKSGMDKNSQTFTSFSGRLTNDFKFIFDQSGILAERAIKLMTNLNAAGSSAFAFQSGNIYQFGADIRKMRMTMNKMYESQDSLFDYLSGDEQNQYLAEFKEQLIGEGISDRIGQDKLLDAAHNQFVALKQVAVSSGKSLEELIKANAHNTDIEDAIQNSGLGEQGAANLRAYVAQLQSIGQTDQANKLIKSLKLGPGREMGAYEKMDFASGMPFVNQVLLDDIRSEKKLTDSGGGIPGRLARAAKRFDPTLARMGVEGAGSSSGMYRMQHLADAKKDEDHLAENIFRRIGTWFQDSSLGPMTDLASATVGLVQAITGPRGLSKALWANTAALIANNPLTGKLLGGGFSGLANLGKGAAWSKAGPMTGMMGNSKLFGGMTRFMSSANVQMLGKSVGRVEMLFGAFESISAFFGNFNKEFHDEFDNITDNAEKQRKLMGAQISKGMLDVAHGYLAFLGPWGLFFNGLWTLIDLGSTALTGKSMTDWVSIAIGNMYDNLTKWWERLMNGMFKDDPTAGIKIGEKTGKALASAAPPIAAQAATTASNIAMAQMKQASDAKQASADQHLDWLKIIANSTVRGAVANEIVVQQNEQNKSAAYRNPAT